MSGWNALNEIGAPLNECIDVWVDHQDFTGRVCNCFYDEENYKFWRWDDNCKNKLTFCASYATHWMPLPEPPKQ